MATIGSLVAELSADSASFERDLGKAQRALKSSSARMNRALAVLDTGVGKVTRNLSSMAKSALSLRNVVGALAGTAGIGLLVTRSIEAADAIAKTADKVGVSTDALQELRVAADLAGVSQNTLDRALQRFSRGVGEAAQGQGELKDTLARYGIVLRDAEGRQRRLEDVLRDYAHAVAGAESDQERLRLSVKAFDSEGAALVNLLRDGGAAMDAARARARDMGLVIEENLLRSAERAQDQLSLLGKVIGTNLTRAILQAAPQITDLSQRVAAAIPRIIDMTARFGEWIGLLQAVPTQRIVELRIEIERLEGSLAEFGETGLLDLLNPIGLAQKSLIEIRLLAARKELDALLERQQELNRPHGRTVSAPAIGILAAGVAGVPPLPRIKDLDAAAAAMRREAEAAAERQRALDAAVQADIDAARQRARALAEAVETPIEAYNREIAALKSLRTELAATGQSSLLTEEQFNRAHQQALARLIEQQRTTEHAVQATERLNGATRDLGFTFSSAFEDAVVSGNRLRDVLQGLAQDILRILVRTGISEPLGTGFAQLLSQGIAGLFAGGGPTGPFEMTTSHLANPGVPAFAHGGVARAGMPALVGERGPEVFVPGVTGTVIPNGKLVEVTIVNNAGAAVAAREERGSDGGVALRVTIDRAVAGAVRDRGSETARALAERFGLGQRLVSR